jgi:hypothetical protein
MGLTILSAILLCFLNINSSSNQDEAANLVGGLSIWKYGRFDLYHVNPPLTRMIAALPVTLFCEPDIDWTTYRHSPDKNDAALRPEFSLGLGFARRNTENLRWYLFISRLACLPFWLIGGYFVRRWANELYGKWAGLTALALWCFSPNILTWGSFVMSDLPAPPLWGLWRDIFSGNGFVLPKTVALSLPVLRLVLPC